jgi:predicted enzyme related to lactoylglutathione lyase
MPAAHLKIHTLIIDSVEPDSLARFWSEVLERPVAGRTGPYVWLQRVGDLGIGFQKVREIKAAKNRIHFDLSSENPRAEEERIAALGGRRLSEYKAGGFLVMADPEGNEFCIIPATSFEVDDDGHTSYLDDADHPSN